MENTDTVDWIVDTFATTYGKSTGAPGVDFIDDVVLNPTGGTLISAGTAASALNMNTGSPKTLTGTFLKGVEGSTSTGGTAVPNSIVISDQSSAALAAGLVVIAPGTSLSTSVTPATGNTSLDVKYVLIIHRDTT